MSVPTMQPTNPHLTCQVIVTPNSDLVQLEEVPVTKVLTKSDFPSALVAAIGEENLAKMPQVTVEETATGYLDGCFSLDMIPESGAIKGTDQHGRVFVTFAVVNPKYKEINEAAEQSGSYRYEASEVALFTVFQRYKGSGDVNRDTFCHRWCNSIPTNDERFLSDCVMSNDKYAAIKEVFDGKHKDLTLGIAKKMVFLNKLKQREDVLKSLDLSEEDVSKYVSKYKKELLSEDDQKEQPKIPLSALDKV